MKIHDQQSCPQLPEDTARFEKTISPILQQLKKYAQSLPHSLALRRKTGKMPSLRSGNNCTFALKAKRAIGLCNTSHTDSSSIVWRGIERKTPSFVANLMIVNFVQCLMMHQK